MRWSLAPRRPRGQVYVELALLTPVILILLFGCLQFAVLFNTHLSVMNVTRDYVRWIVLNPHTTDSASRTLLNSRLPTGITAANLTTTVSPACNSLTSGKCSGRTTGVGITVTSTYSITSLLFLPSTFQIASLSISIPTSLPSYSLTMVVEPT